MLVKESQNAYESLGKVQIRPSQSEKKYLKYRRSIYVVENINENERFTKKNLKIIRPGLGLHPKYYNLIIGKKAKKNIKKGTALKLNIIKSR